MKGLICGFYNDIHDLSNDAWVWVNCKHMKCLCTDDAIQKAITGSLGYTVAKQEQRIGIELFVKGRDVAANCFGV